MKLATALLNAASRAELVEELSTTRPLYGNQSPGLRVTIVRHVNTGAMARVDHDAEGIIAIYPTNCTAAEFANLRELFAQCFAN